MIWISKICPFCQIPNTMVDCLRKNIIIIIIIIDLQAIERDKLAMHVVSTVIIAANVCLVVGRSDDRSD